MRSIKKKFLIILQLLPITLILSNCSTVNKNDNSRQLSDNEIYSKGLTSIEKGDFEKAVLEFDEVFLNYPFSSLASKSEIMSAYSLFQNNELNKAIIKLKKFIEMNPKGELTEYAHYLVAMCYYAQVSSEGRDPGLSIKALNSFKLINSKYPDSKYAKDSRLKIQFLNNSLAKNEMNVGKFYLKKGAPASSINRFKFVLQNYQNTSVIPETLYRLCEALLMIGLKDEAIKSNAILNYNFPDNDWTKLSKKLFQKKYELKQNEDNELSIINYLKDFFE